MENKDILNEELNQTNEQPDNTATASAEETNSKQEAAVDTREAEVAELKDKYLRLYADFENFRRRTAKEKLELVSTASEGLLVALLPVVDDFERAMQSLENTSDVAALKEGVALIFHKLTKTLEAKGLKPMTSKGEPFNADLHESVTQFPAPSEDLKGKVIDEVEKGYYLNDKVIRFAKVVVGS
ncbi:nucleotide exchange factor GrpE [Nibrella viscosa]|uniref:Protein GrpE n=1 Tax=Nibrella viscosa TaxID=1084524 RepID=A0ABP8KDK3_9BACT